MVRRTCPAFRRASRFLATDSSLPFWYTSYFSEVKPMENAWRPANGGQSYEYLYVQDTLTCLQAAKVHAALFSFAEHVHFTVPHSLHSGHHENCTFTYPRRRDGQARIFIAPLLFHGLRRAAATTDRFVWTWLTFRLAQTLCHELAHVVAILQHGEDSHVFFPGHIASEAGYDWKGRVLGGLAQDDWNCRPATGIRPKLLLRKWPNPATIYHYIGAGGSIGLRVKPDPRDVFAPEMVPIGIEVVARRFEESFWTEEVAVHVLAAFHLPWVEWEGYKSALCTRGVARLQAMTDAEERKKRCGGYFDGADLGLRHYCCGAYRVSRRSTGDMKLAFQ